jgi:hypothetical protein
MTLTTERELTQKQELFCQAIFKGMTQHDAYITAYDVRPGTLANTIDSNASQLMDDTKVIQRLNELRDRIESKIALSIAKKREILFNLAIDNEVRPRDRINSIDIDNKMIRLYADTPINPGQTIINVIAYSPETKRTVDALLHYRDEPEKVIDIIPEKTITSDGGLSEDK